MPKRRIRDSLLPPDVEAVALAAIKEAYKHPRTLTREETIEFITRPVNLGWPQRMPSKGRGPKPKRTQYDDAFNARRGLYQKLVRLPRQSKAATEASIPKRHEVSERSRKLVAPVVRKLRKQGIHERNLVNKIGIELSALSPSTIRRAK